jgi:cyclopropane fatty-acyl-phospholipid synthase-like methyltransferase
MERLFRARLRKRPSDWHRTAVGGEWETIGKHQFDYLVSQGLQPHHNLLDVGCGSMRGGVHFVRYLDTGHYVGLDIDTELLEAGKRELANEGLLDKQPTLVHTATFDVSQLGRTFDVALAQSVFTHIPLNSIVRALTTVAKVLVPGAPLYATFFENPSGRTNLGDIAHTPGGIVTHFDHDPFHYSVDDMRWAADGSGLRCEHVGEWNHPRDQRMLRFVREPS